MYTLMYKVLTLFSLRHVLLPAKLTINPALNTELFKQVCDVPTEYYEKEARTYQPPADGRTNGSCTYDNRVSTFHAQNCHFQCHMPNTERSKSRHHEYVTICYFRLHSYLHAHIGIHLVDSVLMKFHIKNSGTNEGPTT
jgi:hypothetical protein